jgi:hypothetical protein
MMIKAAVRAIQLAQITYPEMDSTGNASNKNEARRAIGCFGSSLYSTNDSLTILIEQLTVNFDLAIGHITQHIPVDA